jgi:hypothetical protein
LKTQLFSPNLDDKSGILKGFLMCDLYDSILGEIYRHRIDKSIKNRSIDV